MYNYRDCRTYGLLQMGKNDLQQDELFQRPNEVNAAALELQAPYVEIKINKFLIYNETQMRNGYSMTGVYA